MDRNEGEEKREEGGRWFWEEEDEERGERTGEERVRIKAGGVAVVLTRAHSVHH